MQRSLYEILGVAPASSPTEITSVYRAAKRARIAGTFERGHWHEVREAYTILSNPARRARYDRARARRRQYALLAQSAPWWSRLTVGVLWKIAGLVR